MDFKELVNSRFSSRGFSDKQISEEDLFYILECGRVAPTAKNNQPVKVFAIKSEEGLKKVDQVTSCRYNAPVVLLVCSDKTKAFDSGTHNTFELDASIVATHLILAAESKKINSCFVRLFNEEEIKNIFNISIEPIIFIMLGYKDESIKASGLHYERNDMNEFVEVI